MAGLEISSCWSMTILAVDTWDTGGTGESRVYGGVGEGGLSDRGLSERVAADMSGHQGCDRSAATSFIAKPRRRSMVSIVSAVTRESQIILHSSSDT